MKYGVSGSSKMYTHIMSILKSPAVFKLPPFYVVIDSFNDVISINKFIKLNTDDKTKQSCTYTICQVTAGGVGGVMFLIIIIQFVAILHLCTQRRLVQHCI